MPDDTLLTPVAGDDPCGLDLQWDPAFMALSQSLENMIAQQSEAVVEGEVSTADMQSLDDIMGSIRGLCARTKDLRLFSSYAEAAWRGGGLPAFADAFETLVVAAETWSDPDGGIHPRADEDDGDLGARGAALGKLLNRVSALVDTMGWGKEVNISEQVETATALRGIFDAWTNRLEPAFGRDLPSRSEAWNALKKLIGEPSAGAAGDGEVEGAAAAAPGGAMVAASADAWDTVERAMELMATQDRHSPALPILRLLTNWRSVGILEISETMRVSGVTLEQLLDSIKKQLEPPQ